MAHLADQWWKSHGFPLCVVLIKGRNCFCYKLSPRIDWLQLLQPLVLLDKEKDIILLVQEDKNRKSTRLNSSHTVISYAVFCLKKKKNQNVRAKLTSIALLT